MVFTTIEHPESTRRTETLRRFRQNRAVLDREWSKLLLEHRHEWAAVYADGTVVVRPSLEGIRDAVPEGERDAAIVRYIEENDRTLIL